MEPSSQLPSSSDSNPSNQTMIAHVGGYQSFAAYLGSYVDAVDRLFKAVENREAPADVIALPLLFLMRHSMELGYKFTLWELHQMNDEQYPHDHFIKHRLPELHRALRDQYKKAAIKHDLPKHEVDRFKEYYKKTEAGMKQFNKLDDSSCKFRYPIDTRGVSNFKSDQTVDLVLVKKQFDDAMTLLRHTADVLSKYVECSRWMESEFSENF
jgi:hypothetical protein